MDIKLIALDVDGVLTDGRIIIGSNRSEYKGFHVKDGLGINLARFFGIRIAFISGRTSEAVAKRAAELNIDFLYEGVSNKVRVLNKLICTIGIGHENVCYVGDDINDLPVLRAAGFSCAPKDAHEMVKKNVDFVSSFCGGTGAVRDIIDIILQQKPNYEELLERYLSEQIQFSQ